MIYFIGGLGVLAVVGLAVFYWRVRRHTEKDVLGEVNRLGLEHALQKKKKELGVTDDYRKARDRIPNSWDDVNRMRGKAPLKVIEGSAPSSVPDGGKPKK